MRFQRRCLKSREEHTPLEGRLRSKKGKARGKDLAFSSLIRNSAAVATYSSNVGMVMGEENVLASHSLHQSSRKNQNIDLNISDSPCQRSKFESVSREMARTSGLVGPTLSAGGSTLTPGSSSRARTGLS